MPKSSVKSSLRSSEKNSRRTPPMSCPGSPSNYTLIGSLKTSPLPAYNSFNFIIVCPSKFSRLTMRTFLRSKGRRIIVALHRFVICHRFVFSALSILMCSLRIRCLASVVKSQVCEIRQKGIFSVAGSCPAREVETSMPSFLIFASIFLLHACTGPAKSIV